MGKRKHARDREDYLRIVDPSPIWEKQVRGIQGDSIDSLTLSSIVTPKVGRYKGIQFTVEGFDASEYPDKPVRLLLWGKVGEEWISIWAPTTKLEYMGKMPVKAWGRRSRAIPSRPITLVEHAEQLARGGYSEPTDKVHLIAEVSDWESE